MRILYVSHGAGPDYQNDVILHGLKTIYGKEVYETADNWYMYDDMSQNDKAQLYGKGFTLYGLLPASLKNTIELAEVKKKIKEKFFDYIFFGSIRRCNDFFFLVIRSYERKNVVLIDGEDDTSIAKPLVNTGLYFKRELEGQHSDIFPVCFGIPQSKISQSVAHKTKNTAHIIPGDLSTYIFTDECAYYNDYQTSYFGVTCKKGGWDCMRHYEIMANGCIPYFINLDKCPHNTLSRFPKDLILRSNDLYKSGVFRHEELEDICRIMLDWTLKYLTTESVATYVLNRSAEADLINTNRSPFYNVVSEIYKTRIFNFISKAKINLKRLLKP
jgi:hypothetical protein